MKDKTQFDSLVKVCNRVSINYHTCVIQIAQSFSNESYYYDNRIKDNEEDSIEWNISSEDKKSIAKYYTGDVYDIIIIKNLCVCLKLKTAYDKNDRVLQVIYVYDKNKFEQCYPTYTYPDKQNETISDKTDWVYFYDNHWAISPCSVFLQMDTIEIRKILTNEK
jgi:hypothetical protein